MKNLKSILVSVDARENIHPALDWATVIARHTNATIKIVDVLPDFPWYVRHALRDHDQVRSILLAEKRDRLAELAAPLRAQDLRVATEALSGQTSVELVREVLREGHGLVVRITKAAGSRRPGYFGNTTLQLLRNCPCPVWIAQPNRKPRFQHILGAVDATSQGDESVSLNSDIIALTRSIAQSQRGAFDIIHAWSVYGEQMLRSELHDDEIHDLERCVRQNVETSLAKLLAVHGLSVHDKNVHLVKGEPSQAIPHFIESHEVDVLVMGTVGRRGVAGLLMGNTAEMILNRVPCAILALKPQGFVSPIKV